CMILQEKQRYRAAHEAGASDDDGALAGRIDVLTTQQFEHAKWRCRNEGGVALGQPAGVVGVEPVYIFMWRDLFERLIRIETLRQRHLEQDAVDSRIVRQLRDSLVQPGLGDL